MDRTLEKVKMNSTLDKLTFWQILFLSGLFVKQFYVLPSGSLQIGDILMLCSFLGHFLFKKKGALCIYKDEYYILGYFFLITIINSIYFLIYHDIGFIKSILYYLFNIMILLAFVEFTQEKELIFLKALRKTVQYGLIMQMLIFLSGFGRWYAVNRYEGTFNDPNQYGVFIFFSVLIIYITGCMLEKKNWLWVLLGFLLIVPSASSGMLVGYAAFLVSLFIVNNYRINLQKVLLVVFLLTMVTFLLIGLWSDYIKIPDFITDISMYKRMIERIEYVFGDSLAGAIISDRGWERFFSFPEYILFGAGEGKYDRFGTDIEIHSSILGPIFYYGIFPFVLFLCWCGKKIKRIEKKWICVYIALLFESFFLINTRQPMFWIIIALAGIRQHNKKNKNLFLQNQEDGSLSQERINHR